MVIFMYKIQPLARKQRLSCRSEECAAPEPFDVHPDDGRGAVAIGGDAAGGQGAVVDVIEDVGEEDG